MKKAETSEHPTATTSIRSVEKAFAILEVLSERGAMSLRSLARQLDLHESTTHHLLATLKRQGYIEQDEERGEYGLGLHLIGLANRYLTGMDLYKASTPQVRRLCDRSGETTYLTVLHGVTLVNLLELTGTRPIQARRPHLEGDTALHSTASGKTLLAHVPAERREAVLCALRLTPFTDATITDSDALRAELASIRRQGYGLDREENIEGVMCVAAPIFNHHGHCLATTSVACLRTGAERIAELTTLVVETATAISGRLGFVPAKRTEDVA